jgi:AraC family transcriptional regulator
MTPLVPVPAARALSVHKVCARGFHWTHAFHAEGYVGSHAHSGMTLTLVARGSYQESNGRGDAGVMALGSAWLRPAGAPHANRFPRDGVESLVLEVDGDRYSEIAECWPGIAGQARFDSPEITRLGRQLRIESHAPDSAASLVVEASTLELLAVLARLSRGESTIQPPPHWLKRVHEALADDRSTNWDVRTLAQTAGVHPVHLARAFRIHYGISPGEWLRERRLQQARETLIRSAEPLSQIAQDAGYADQSHFSRAFHRRFGLAPGRFRTRPLR